MAESLIELLHRAAAIRGDGRRVLGCLVVGARGSTPQSAGAVMLVDDAASIHGTIGGGCVEAEVRQRAVQMLGEGGAGVMRFTLDHDYGWDDGLICGGTLELAVAPMPEAGALRRAIDDVEHRRPVALDWCVATDAGPVRYTLRVVPHERLYIAGAGHVGGTLARLAQRLEFEVTMFDDRADLLARAAPPAAHARPGSIEEALAAAPIDDRTYCVIVTRGHRHDARALAAVLGRGARYVGMIGSRRKVKLIRDELADRGADPEALARVHAPIGIGIGAVTVEEIALSIAAQLVQQRRAGSRPAVDGPHPIAAGEAVPGVIGSVVVSAGPDGAAP